MHFLYGVVNGSRRSLRVYDTKAQKVELSGKVESSFPPNAAFAPDGHSVAYQSGEALNQVFVQPFPATESVYPVSRPDSGSLTAGTNPFWSSDGKELFYSRGPGDHVVVQVKMAPSFSVSNPVLLPSDRGIPSGPGTPRE